MKRLTLIFCMLLPAVATVQAGSLMNYIEMPLQATQLLQFSSSGLAFKACERCDKVVLKPSAQLELLENGQPIDLQRATELYVKKQPETLSVFYFRDSLTFDRVSFGSLPGPR